MTQPLHVLGNCKHAHFAFFAVSSMLTVSGYLPEVRRLTVYLGISGNELLDESI